MTGVSIMLGLELNNPWLIGAAGILILIFTLMRRGRRRQRSSTVDGRAHVHRELHNSRLESQTREDINELMVRLEELSREICGQIDTRYAKLELLLRRAEGVLAELRAMSGRSEQAASKSDPWAAPDSLWEEAKSEAAPADPKHMRIWELAAKGQAAVEIARQTGLTVGEVELVLALERSRRQLGATAKKIQSDAASLGGRSAGSIDARA